MSGIRIHRSHHSQNFTVVPNVVARDQRLSFLARGLLVFLLSLPPEWHVTADLLAEHNPDSRGAIRSAMRELRDKGYVVLITERGPDGRTRRHLEVYDTDETKRRQLALGVSRENSASPQVAPNAGKPAVGGAAFKSKDGKPRGRAGEASPSPPPRSNELCTRCGGYGHDADNCPTRHDQ